jgi:hypothetical protein
VPGLKLAQPVSKAVVATRKMMEIKWPFAFVFMRL